MPIFKFFHIATMFFAVALSVGTELVAHRVVRTGDVRAIRALGQQREPIATVVPIMYVVGMIFGLFAAYYGQINFFEVWLLIAYTLFVIALLLNSLTSAYFGRVTAAAMASAENSPSDELKALLDASSAWYLTTASFITIILFVAVMVFKPFR